MYIFILRSRTQPFLKEEAQSPIQLLNPAQSHFNLGTIGHVSKGPFSAGTHKLKDFFFSGSGAGGGITTFFYPFFFF